MLIRTTWEDWEKDVLEVICFALMDLINYSVNIRKEDDLNRILGALIRKHKKNWEIKNKKYLLGSCLYHVPGQPELKDNTKISRENKIPEFSWEFADYQNNLSRDYHLECKRLCKNENNYSREYVVNGILRYKRNESSYGIHCKSGLMIGYLQDINHITFFTKINNHLKKRRIEVLKLEDSFIDKGISRLTHSFKRRFDISPFRLGHLWIDLR